MDEARAAGGAVATGQAVADALERVPLFTGLSVAERAEVAACGEEVTFPAGTVIARQGDPADGFYVILDGVTEWSRRVGGQDVHAVTLGPGEVFAELILLLDAPYPTTGRALTPLRLLRVPTTGFWTMLSTHPTVLRRLVRVAAERSQIHESVAMQQAKLAGLGSLAAGLAHELNNPVATVSAGTANLGTAWAELSARAVAVGGALSDEDRARVAGLVARPGERDRPALTSLQRSAQEDLLADLLEERGVDDAFELAATLVDVGAGEEWLAELTALVPADALRPTLAWVAADLAGRGLLSEVGAAATRVASLVGALKDYTLLDQAPEQDVRVADGIEATLRVLAPRLGPGVEIVTEFDPGLPPVPARAADLNQVWTNLIGNAADALAGAGRLRLRTARDGDRVVVDVVDDGPGIAPDVLPRIWDPFFTTRGVGEGVGLGLDVTRRIVAAHGGDVRVESRPGETRFTVRLPVRRERHDA